MRVLNVLEGNYKGRKSNQVTAGVRVGDERVGEPRVERARRRVDREGERHSLCSAVVVVVAQ